jgi:crossover junction endodeoxyribonuclease RusA
MTFTFVIPGDPRPQGSKQAFRRGDKIALVETTKGLKQWRQQITMTASQTAGLAKLQIFEGPVQVRVMFNLRKPPSVRRLKPLVKPDLDKLLRALFDGITDSKAVWTDDAQVITVLASKRYATREPHTVVEVSNA